MAAAPAAPTIDPEYYARLRQLESGGDPNAVNPTSGAAGLFQFMPATASYYGLTDPTNQDQAYAAVQRLTADNASVLSRGFGRNPTDAELYLAHQQGAGGAMKLLSNPNAKAVDLVGRAAVLSNGGTADMTASDFTSMWKSRFGMSPTGNGQAPYNPPPLNAGRFSGGYIQTAQDAGRQRLMADAVASAPQGSGNDLVDSLVGEAGKTRQDVKSGLEFYGVPWPLSELGGEAVGLGKLGVSAVGAGYNAAVNAALDFAQSHGMSESDRNRLQRDIGQLTEVSGAAVPEAGSLAAGGGAIRDDIISTLKKWAPEGTAEHFAQATDLHPLGGAPMEQSFPARRPPGGPRPPRVLPRAAADEGETLTAPPPMGHNQPPEAMAPEPPPPARAEMT
ncbi:MAG TPA: transglycosylase SLT domain-containing protein, partial [Dongiaceae bacterium]|nr:transglycosylase SLT domain-containing protein [Dongiaceae bacterium]